MALFSLQDFVFCLHAKFPLSLQIIDNIYNGSLIHVLQPIIACTNHKIKCDIPICI